MNSNGVLIPAITSNSAREVFNYSRSYTSWTAGALFKFNPNTSLFVRASRGGRFNGDRQTFGGKIASDGTLCTGVQAKAGTLGCSSEGVTPSVGFVKQYELGLKNRGELAGGRYTIELTALTRDELGDLAAERYARAAALAHGNRDVMRNQALALISEGRGEVARRLLEAELAREPGWLDGHKALATLEWTSGNQSQFSSSLAQACRKQPANPVLWLAWFRNLAQARDWAGAVAVLDEAEHHFGATPAIQVSRLFVAVESSAPDAADQSAATAQFRGDVSSLCRIRHALRQGNPARAEAEALPLTAGSSAMLYWPYLSLAWRLQEDARAEWLDQPERLIRTFDCGWSPAGLGELAEVLRGLHTAAAPYLEQSVRGGTQTDRSVLLRREPVLQRLKARLLDLMLEYVGGLPAPDPAHPLLGAPRGDLLIEGSWSVRLASQGHNVPHTHAMGWLSTAFYVALPGPAEMGPPPAGHIAFDIRRPKA